MNQTFRIAAITGLALLILSGCVDPLSPDGPEIERTGAALQTVEVDGPEDIPLPEGTAIPPGFFEAATILSTLIDAGFKPGYAYSHAYETYFATHAKIELSLVLKRGETRVDSASTVAVEENLTPFTRKLSAPLNLSTPGPCGYRTDSQAKFHAWHSYPVPPTGIRFEWGLVTVPGSMPAEQPACPPGGQGGSDGDSEEDWDFDPDWDPGEEDEPYNGTCYTCQLWLALHGDLVLDSWWECNEVDDLLCESDEWNS